MMDQPWDIPKIWKWVEIKSLGEIVSGGTPSTKEASYWGNDVNWITPADLTGYTKKTIAKGAKSISYKGLAKSSAKLMPAGSIHFSSRAPIGYVAISSQPLSTNQGFKSLVPSQGVFNEYVYYYLKAARNIAEERASGTTFREISGSTFGRLPFPFPPLPEQNEIVSKIEELFSELDNGIESLKKAREQLKTYRQAVLKYAFEGKLTEGWRAQQIKLPKAIEKSAESAIAEGKWPEEWKYYKLGEVIKTIDGDRGPNYPKKDDFYKQGYCLFLTTKNMREDRFVFEDNIYITKEKDKILRGGKLRLNDVVVTTRGTLGNVALYDENIPFKNVRINSGMLILRVVKPILKQLYLMKFISSPWFSKQLNEKRSGSAQPQIPANILREIKIPIPLSLAEQKAIVSEIESRLSVCDKLEQIIEDSLKKSEALRQSILKKAFDGELTKEWREQHPELVSGENSAKKLLARIRAEKEKNSPQRRKERRGKIEK